MKKSNKRSFTLVELLITMVVSVVVISGVILSLVNTMVLNEYNQGFSVAMNIARAKLEDQLAQRSPSTWDNIVDVPSATLTKALDGIDGLYRIEVSNPVIGGNPVTDIKDITVSVCWKARAGRIIGDCEISGGNLAWKSPYSSPCRLSTSIARR